ncbi:MAG TPA: hypothetical protein VJU87_04685, partial [Gemmatimonadaceae bacterium]|nr:hypothetical protein [Gemmatimonadaceae bacterium]
MRIAEHLQPIGRKLPLAISALLVVIFSAFSWSAYREVEHVLLGAAGEKMIGVSQRLAVLLDESARRVR